MLRCSLAVLSAGAALVVVYNVLGRAIAAAEPYAVAAVIMGLCASGLTGAGGMLLAGIVWQRGHEPRARVHPEVIDADRIREWRQPMPAHLPARVVTVPVVTANGKPSSARARRAVTLESTERDGAVLQVDAAEALRFARLATPSRAEWHGDKVHYGLIARWFAAHGVLERPAANRYKWADGFDADARAEWVEQFAAE